MEFAELVRKRRIVRHFKPDPIDPEVVDRMLDLARRIPTAGFSQGQDFIVITDPETKRAVGRLCGEAEHYEKGFGHPLDLGGAGADHPVRQRGRLSPSLPGGGQNP